MLNLSDHVWSFSETVLPAGYLLATYFMEIPASEQVLDKVAGLAIGQTIGTWTPVPGITGEMLAHHMGRVISIYDIPPVELVGDLPTEKRAFIVQIAFPEVNFGAQFPMLLTTLLGNDVSTSAQLKLVDVHVSASLAAALAGPRFGVEGIRKLAGEPTRPLILNVLKPCTGFPTEAGVAWFEASARGGCDVIKDDELLSNPSFNLLAERVKLYREASQRVFEETGHRTLYCANVTDQAVKIVENARRAIELGADMIMLNVFATGLGVLQSIAQDNSINVPILSHFASVASLTEAPRSGIASPLLIGKLQRLAGADAAIFSSPYSVYPLLREKFIRIAQYMRLPLYDIKSMLPVPGGGVHPATAVSIINDLGLDIMLDVGGAIQGHPSGAIAGARAMRAAIDSILDGIPLVEKACNCLELKVAIEKWGASA